MDDVFRALADPTRRSLLDELFRQDGQSLRTLERRLPMTRFGVMKHLRVLEQAGLVVTRRRGREKLHFLNAVPIRLLHDRWVSKFAAPWAAALADLKQDLETSTVMSPMSPTSPTSPTRDALASDTMAKVFEIYIKTTPERLWQAIVDPELRAKYSFGVGVHSTWQPGAPYRGLAHAWDDKLIFDGEVLEIDPPRRLVQSFRAQWSDAARSEGTSRITWEIEPIADSCRLTVTHDRLRAGANPELYGGWPMVLSGLKTLLETGELLTTPASLQYARHDVAS